VSRSARRATPHPPPEPVDNSLLDLVDNLLNKGVVVTGELTLGLAGIDLVYLELSALLAAADRVMPVAGRKRALSRRAQPILPRRWARPPAVDRAERAQRDAASPAPRGADRVLRRRARPIRRGR
jgi:hypothetical protein